MLKETFGIGAPADHQPIPSLWVLGDPYSGLNTFKTCLLSRRSPSLPSASFGSSLTRPGWVYTIMIEVGSG